MPLTPAQKQARYRARLKLAGKRRLGAPARKPARVAAPKAKPPAKPSARARDGTARAPELAPTVAASLAPLLDLRDPRAVCEATVADLRRELDRLSGDKLASSRDRASVSTALVSATRLLARLSGALDITKSQIVRSPHWVEIAGAIAEALAPYPDAAEACAAAIARLEGS